MSLQPVIAEHGTDSVGQGCESEGGDSFAGWASGLVKAGDLSQRSADKYRTLWQAWRGWLVLRELDWRRVTGGQVEEFLCGAAPGQGGRRPAIHLSRMSSYTRQRYWRLLRGVYATAVQDGTLASSPVLEVPQARRPSISSRDRQSQVLEPSLFAALHDAEVIKSIIPVKNEKDWWHPRDRAMVALLVATGITTTELIDLRGMDLKRLDRRLIDLRGPNAGEVLPPLMLDVMEGQDGLGRCLQICEELTPLLYDWLRERHALLLERAARSMPGASKQQRAEFLTEHDCNGPLFMARRARAGAADFPAMQAVTVYYTVSQALKRLRTRMAPTQLEQSAGEVPDEPYVAKGAAVIRNSVIREWLDNVGAEETVKRAGLQSVDSLRLVLQSK